MSTPGQRLAANWTAERERGHLWVLRLMRWFAVSGGRRAARVVLHPITLYFLLANGKARRASAQYLQRALKRPVGWRDSYHHIHHFAATVLDRVYLLQERFDQFEITSQGEERLRAMLAEGHGVMLAGAHLGSFEALRSTAQMGGAQVAMLMYEDNARLINTTLAAIAPNVQLQTIALGRPGAMLALRRWLDDGGLAGLLADRTLPDQGGRSRTQPFDFLGRSARFSDGPFRLAALLRRPVVFMAGLYEGGNRYALRFVELADFRVGAPDHGLDVDQRVREAMLRYVGMLEALCLESPYNWFNFFDFWGDESAPTDSSTADAAPR